MASEEILAHRCMNIACHFLEIRSKGNKRCFNFLVGGGHDEILFCQKDVSKRGSRIGGQENSSHKKLIAKIDER